MRFLRLVLRRFVPLRLALRVVRRLRSFAAVRRRGVARRTAAVRGELDCAGVIMPALGDTGAVDVGTLDLIIPPVCSVGLMIPLSREALTNWVAFLTTDGTRRAAIAAPVPISAAVLGLLTTACAIFPKVLLLR